jgi:hypothetical protein
LLVGPLSLQIEKLQARDVNRWHNLTDEGEHGLEMVFRDLRLAETDAERKHAVAAQ